MRFWGFLAILALRIHQLHVSWCRHSVEPRALAQSNLSAWLLLS